ncbi:Carbohydrate-binding module family 20 protein [Teratosphaeria destructans]|uniref:laccase n=1 Tax=Teratosphaeria destructans TaxID=418781 RepID=A0A9W7W6Y6_9PEZI|nr:Carbohydrate-binding module family 20 protein [Teratosphaeria destructans]
MPSCDSQSGCVAVLFHDDINECSLLSSVGSNTANGKYNLAVRQGSSTSTSAAQPASKTVAVTFKETVTTAWGESVVLVGSISQLGNWDPASGVAMSASDYTDSNHVWSVTIDLPAGEGIQYKYVRVGTDGSYTWEADPNHVYTVPLASTVSTTESDTWQSVPSSSSSTTSSAKLASTVSGTVSATTYSSVTSRATCTNAPDARNCWTKGFDIDTDFDDAWPDTGRTVTYDLTITNTTLSPDGYGRFVFAINGQYPGPVIEANWGDTLQITVNNQMQDNGTSIHWHGLRQYHNNGQDGVPGVTECPIAPGKSKTYTFKATQYGTSWYHSHFSCQYGDGVLGPIVIHGPATANYDIDMGALPITDWYYQGVNYHAAIAEHTNSITPPIADNGLINGSMTSVYGGSYSKSQLTQGKRHRVRLVNTAVDNHFVVSFDSHQMEVIAADFVPIRPFNTTNIFLGIGQRYDVIITANQSPGAYWFRAEVQTDCGGNYNNGNIKSIFAYEGHESETPISTAYSYTSRCTDQTGLVPHWDSYVPQGKEGTFTELTTDLLQKTESDGSLTLYWQTGNTSYPGTANMIELPQENVWLYWVIQEVAGDPYNVAVPHPVHLHGHDFYVLGTGDTTWTAADADNLNYDNPPRRDTAMLNTNGWLALAFQTDNPGAWIMHCHITWHADEGFSVQFLESASTILSTSTLPGDFDSQCSAWDDYYNDHPAYLQGDSGI